MSKIIKVQVGQTTQPLQIRYKGKLVDLTEKVKKVVGPLLKQLKSIKAVSKEGLTFTLRKIGPPPKGLTVSRDDKLQTLRDKDKKKILDLMGQIGAEVVKGLKPAKTPAKAQPAAGQIKTTYRGLEAANQNILRLRSNSKSTVKEEKDYKKLVKRFRTELDRAFPRTPGAKLGAERSDYLEKLEKLQLKLDQKSSD